MTTGGVYYWIASEQALAINKISEVVNVPSLRAASEAIQENNAKAMTTGFLKLLQT